MNTAATMPMHYVPRSATNGTASSMDAKNHSRPLPRSLSTIGPSEQTAVKEFDHAEAARKIKQEYTHGRKEPGARGLDCLHGLIKALMQGEPNLNEFLKTVAKAIYTQFNIKDVSICLRGQDDIFRYATMHGMREEVWAAPRNIAYTLDQVLDPNLYKGTEISRFTKLFLAEDNPYAESEGLTCSGHLMTTSKRRTAEESIEGDYLDVFIFGPKDEVLGWIETSGTWDGRLPDARTIRGLEVLSSVLALAIVRSQAKRD